MTVISATQAWLQEIIIDLNVCPFAKKEFVNNTIHYHVCSDIKLADALETLILQCEYLEEHNEIETSLIIFDQSFVSFDHYLDLLEMGNQLLVDSGYEGIFQLASFHPQYCFEGEDPNDAANFTNRSPYPILHILREQSLEKVLAVYTNPEEIPENNIAMARAKGSEFFIEKLQAFKSTKH